MKLLLKVNEKHLNKQVETVLMGCSTRQVEHH